MVIGEIAIFKELPPLIGVIILLYLLIRSILNTKQKNEEANQQRYQKNEEANQQRYQKNEEARQKNEESNQQRYAELVKSSQYREEANQQRYAELVTISQDRYEEISNISQDRYEELSNRYIDSMSQIVTDNTKCSTELCTEVHSQREELKEQMEILKDHVETKDRALNMLNNKDDIIRTVLQRNEDLYNMLKHEIRYPVRDFSTQTPEDKFANEL